MGGLSFSDEAAFRTLIESQNGPFSTPFPVSPRGPDFTQNLVNP